MERKTVRLLFLLGSGVSFPSGMPSAKVITSRVLYSRWFKDSKYVPQKSGISTDACSRRIQEFLRVWRDKNPEKNYEDLFDFCNDLGEGCAGVRWKLLATEFGVQIGTPPQDLDSSHFGFEACRLIQWVVYHSLFPYDRPQGMELITQVVLSGRYEVDIATLNHDLLAEQTLKDAGIQFVDGFDFPDPDGNGNRFTGHTLTKPRTQVRLFKLHGSVNWYLDDKYRDEKACIKVDPWVKPPVRVFPEPRFLSGTRTKILDYKCLPFSCVFSHLKRAMKNTSRIVASGYGFRDCEINRLLCRWLKQAKGHRLILLHEKPYPSLDGAFPLAVKDQIRKHPRWLSDTSIGELDRLLK